MVADDTNVWVNNSTVARMRQKENAEQDVSGDCVDPKFETKRGMKKMQSMLGMLQHVSCRFDGDARAACEDIVQLHVPSQLLPRANWSTIHDRMVRWSVFSGVGGCSEALGGDRLWEAFKNIPLKLVIHCAELNFGTRASQSAHGFAMPKSDSDK